MKTEFWMIGKTTHSYLPEPIKMYEKRIAAFTPFSVVEFKIAKHKKSEQILKAEEEVVLKNLKPTDILVLLDEKGKEFTSYSFAKFIQNLQMTPKGTIIFLAGGAYGFSKAIYDRCNYKVALSKMTFTHEMVRIIFLEQLYRAHTILNNHPYHN